MGQVHRIPERLADQQGVALLTGILLMMIMTVIGIAAITLTGLENRLAGFVRAGEAGSVAAEACLSTAKITIEQSYGNGGVVPAALLDNAAPVGPVPAGNKATLDNEIRGVAGFENLTDILPATYPNFNIGVPNPAQALNNFTVQGDIDRLFLTAKAGSGMESSAGYKGTGSSSAAGGTEILYQINCLATNAATNSRARIIANYACTATSQSCQRKP